MFGDLEERERKQAALIVLVAALGYFVDIFDLLLFGMVRVKSLTDLGVPADQMLGAGAKLISLQMWGMLAGGLLWGVLGDKKGRLSVLFGSIITYSIANIANSYVTSVDGYALWRFIAGVGLAGELGAGITLVAEVLPKSTRGIGTSVVAGVGILGAVVGYEISTRVDWRMAYQIGGGLGIVLLLLRVGVTESGMFNKVRTAAQRGSLGLLFSSPARLRKLLAVIALGLPLWYMVGILVTFSPEFAGAAGLLDPATGKAAVVSAGRAISACYLGLAIGDLLSGFVSQALASRRKAVMLYVVVQLAAIAFYYQLGLKQLDLFYPACFLMGLGGGYWALFVTMGAEQFGTEIRATVATSVPNFVRGAVPLMVAAFVYFKGSFGSVLPSGLAVGAAVFALCGLGLWAVDETYDKDLDYTEA
jgi:predicted MFS family arabinose efflux permease